ncbi:Tetratricopeptide repeat protein 8 [Geodia barretti]|uniref:Tetratricopeptide repeat protein 8 n=1 Tax=Geodia barretti TaxID=519541 RepID=A0AA35TX29_GEOBA|nr:Tetratricopeptide repeat protein 8 [Geodia barretti]
MDEEGIAEAFLDDTAIADVASELLLLFTLSFSSHNSLFSGPGTSLKGPPGTTSRGLSQGIRPVSQSGRPLSGFVRPGTQGGRPGTMEQALRTARTAMTARPVTSASGRHVRLGTASMLTEPGGPFVDVSKLNMSKYSQRPALAKALFEYLFHHENNVRAALDLAALATEACQFGDWWWKIQLGKCYYRLGMYRDAESQFKSSLKHFSTIDMFLYLGKVYVKLDQPLSALDYYKRGLEKFPNNTSLLIAIARIHEGLNDLDSAVEYYRQVLKYDSTCVEAIACIGTHHFYNDQPEIALRFYRRLLQVGVYNAELFTNLGLCCFYAQQYDMAISCLLRGLQLSPNDDNTADVWYNIGHITLAVGSVSLAYQCFKLALTSNNSHAEAYNNLGVIEWRRGRGEQAMTCFQSSASISPHLYQPHYNLAAASEKTGNLHSSYSCVKKSLEVFPEHLDSAELMKQLQQHFAAL